MVAHVMIEVDLSTQPIEGSLRADDGVARPFAGYMQLVTALEAALSASRGAEIASAVPVSAEPSGA